MLIKNGFWVKFEESLMPIYWTRLSQAKVRDSSLAFIAAHSSTINQHGVLKYPGLKKSNSALPMGGGLSVLVHIIGLRIHVLAGPCQCGKARIILFLISCQKLQGVLFPSAHGAPLGP
jgi:hypothetical protein